MDALALRELCDELIRIEAELKRLDLKLAERLRMTEELAAIMRAVRKVTG